ncbi:MAG: hypothetical protein HYS13_09020 [Planctomycetia bacterium]|nr:hypothetical protein [Planctomycetia bacterium]
MPDFPLNVIREPACRHLLSKGMYVTGQLDPAVDDVEHLGDGHCWCALTQQAFGPDDQFVERAKCGPGRKCYEPRV